MIRLLIADDLAISREGLKRILEATGDMSVVAEAANGPEAVDKVRTSRPDVVVMDLSMPGQGGLETAHELKRLLPAVRILMLTTHPEDHFAVRALREGADGYMTKDTRPEVLVSAIRQLHGGRKYISPTLAEHLALSLRDRTGGPPHQRLSTRELEILLMIGEGKTVGQIARELHLSVKTVSTYRTRILEKMNLRNNAEIMRYVLDQDLAR
ncbi:MAG TPA: response regulator transcription factor [Thermoanaerobaculia bacterium]